MGSSSSLREKEIWEFAVVYRLQVAEQSYCDAPKPGGPLTTRQPAEYKWMSGYPTPLQKIRQSLLCTGSSTQIQNLYKPAFTCPKQSNICNIYPIRPLGPIN